MARLAPLLVLLLVSAAPPQVADPAPPAPSAARPAERAVRDLAPLLAGVRGAHELPGLAALVLRDGEPVARGAVGVRRVDDDVPVEPGDPWHLGSCTKAMTATLCARLVERGALAWDRTVAEAFPELADAMDPAWREVTLELLLQNRAGAPADLGADGLWGRLWQHPGPPTAARLALVEGVVTEPPVHPPGERYLYSNAGFAIAGAMAERAAGMPYEALLAREVFEPLGMDGAGFGAPGVRGEVAAPFGHAKGWEALEPRELGPGDDNPAAIAPAGTVHAPLDAWAQLARAHLRGARGDETGYLAPETFARLHEPALAGYAMGWVVRENAAGERMLWHNGSNTMWYAACALVPSADVAVLLATNRGDGVARQAVEGLLGTLLQQELARGDRAADGAADGGESAPDGATPSRRADEAGEEGEAGGSEPDGAGDGARAPAVPLQR